MTRIGFGIALTILFPGLAARVGAQAPSSVSGRVIDDATGAPLAEAIVELDDQRQPARSDGSFAFGSVAPGRREVRARMIGYAPRIQVVMVDPGSEATTVLRLLRLPVILDSVVVRGDVASEPSVDGESLRRRGVTLARALDGWEGIVVRRAGSGGPSVPQVRGSAPEEVLVLLDGFPLNDPLSGRADLSRVASADVERVTLLSGAQGGPMGSRAIAGVIVIESRPRFLPTASVSASSYGARDGRLAGSWGRLSASASGERYADAFPFRIPEELGGGDRIRHNAGGWLLGGNARWNGPIDLQVRAAISRRGLPGLTVDSSLTARAEDRSLFLGLRGAGPIWYAASLELLDTRAQDAAPSPPEAPYDSRTFGYGSFVSGGLRRNARVGAWHGQAGIALEARYDRFGGDGVRPGADFLRGSLRVDGEMEQGGRDVWSLTPTIRLDHWSGREAPAWSGRLGLGWRHRQTTATASLGSAVTPPALIDLLFREGVGVRINPDLRPERVRWEAEAGVRQSGRVGSVNASVSIRAYYGRVADMIIWAADFRNIWSPRNFDILRRGGEVTLALTPLSHLSFDGSAALSVITYDHAGGAQVAYRPRTTFAAGTTWSPRRWSADLRWHRIGKRFRDSNGVNARPAISLLDAGVERSVGRLTIRAEGHDLTDERAEFIAGFPTPGRMFTLSLTMVMP